MAFACAVLWLKNDEVIVAFEVESTTTMTSALQRGSNLPLDTEKVMVIPEERRAEFLRKMQSPLFKDSFEKHSWKLLYFDMLQAAYVDRGNRIQLESLMGRPLERKQPGRVSAVRQQRLKF